MISGIKGMLLRKGLIGQKDIDGFLRDVSGVIHVGANTGQERKLYAQYRLRVAWIEPLAEVFAALQANLAAFPDQRALQSLITDQDDREYPFHVANNAGGSSSILDLYLHKDVWPEVTYTKTIMIRSKTLVTLLKDEHIDPSAYDALVMDTQGSELLVLQGAIPLLGNFKYIKIEVADFEAYKGCSARDRRTRAAPTLHEGRPGVALRRGLYGRSTDPRPRLACRLLDQGHGPQWALRGPLHGGRFQRGTRSGVGLAPLCRRLRRSGGGWGSRWHLRFVIWYRKSGIFLFRHR